VILFFGCLVFFFWFCFCFFLFLVGFFIFLVLVFFFFLFFFSFFGGVVFLGLFECFFFCDFNLWLIGIFLVVLFLFFRDLGREYKYYGIGSNLFCIKIGCVLFIFSEVLLFLSLFWLNFNFLFSVDSVLGNV